ncbi:MAG: radical SAM protein [Myxococcota bacterium]
MIDLGEHLRRLLEPHHAGDRIAPDLVFVGVSTELGLRIRLLRDAVRDPHRENATEAEPTPIDVELAPLVDAERFAVAAGSLALSYRTSPQHRVDPAVGKSACEAVAVLVRRNEAAFLEGLEGLEGLREGEPGARIRPVRVRRVLEPAHEGFTPFYTLSPYVGCLIGCRFCYAQRNVGAVRRLLSLPELPWGSYVDVRENAAEVLAQELATFEPRPIKFCPIVSDPYQAIERRARLTRACLGSIAAADRPFPTLLLTRSTLILEDVELIASLPEAYVGVSLPTVDDDARQHFEPRAASIEDRLRVLQIMREHGVRTLAVVQPMLPGSVEAMADALAARVDSVSIDILRGEEGAASDFDLPLYRHARAKAWQLEHAKHLRAALEQRGVPVWHGELPPELER